MLFAESASAQESGLEELTRGPIHEAFASSMSFNPEPGILVHQSPPEMIDEIPPDQRPEGDNVSWIPGYWAWDEDQKGFIWISGIWRKLPPGRQWNPGYWSQVDDQSQWTSGYWADQKAQEVAYLPRPPKSLESGPNIAAPSKNHIWVSGNWTNRNDRYGWTPGYWQPAQKDWIWIPSHYQWTRRGYVFIDGYWDYNVPRRGVMFAPVRFHGDEYRRPGYSYTPLLAISLHALLDHLFVRPSYGHYYFGDYYSPSYRDNGYYSSNSYYSDRNGYDPIYSYDRWVHRDDNQWDSNRINEYNYYRDNVNARPAHTWAEMQNSPTKGIDSRDNYAFAQPLPLYAKQADSGQQFQKVDMKSRDQYVEQSKQIRDYGQERRQIENKKFDRSEKDSDAGSQVTREKLIKSPLSAKPAEQLKGKDVPPKRQTLPASELEPTGKSADQTNKQDKSPKPNKDANGKNNMPGRSGDKGTEPNTLPKSKDTPLPEPQAEPDKKAKPEKKSDGKGDNRIPTPGRPANPETDQVKKPEVNPNSAPPERRKVDPPRAPKAEPELRKQAEPAPERPPEAPPKRQPEPPRQAKPEKNPIPKPEAAPDPRVKPQPTQRDRIESPPRHQPAPPIETKPERKPDTKPEAPPAPKSPSQPSVKAPEAKEAVKDPAEKKKKEH